MRYKSLIALGFGVFLTGCAFYSNYQWTGTFMYEGLDYPVFQADREIAGETKKVFILYLPNTKPGDAIGRVKECDAPNLKDCTQVFGAAIRDRFEPKPQRDEGMGY